MGILLELLGIAITGMFAFAALKRAGAENLWIASSHLLKGQPIEPGEVPEAFSRNADKFSAFHVETLLALMADAAALEPSRNTRQQALIEAARQFFSKRKPDPTSWSTS